MDHSPARYSPALSFPAAVPARRRRGMSRLSLIGIILFSLLIVMSMVIFLSTRSAATTVYAKDGFNRTIINGWGMSQRGGSYALMGNRANYDVDGSAGTILVPKPGDARAATLHDAIGQDVSYLVRVAIDRPAVGGPQEVYAVVRRVNNKTEYRLGVKLNEDGTAAIRILRVVDGTIRTLGDGVPVTDLGSMDAPAFWMRAEATDVNPTTLRIKVWPDGTDEPVGWSYGFTDTEPLLQAAGATGVRTFIGKSTTNAPVLFTIDELEVVATPPLSDPVLVGAGDIAFCKTEDDSATANLIDGIRGTVFTVGDQVYPNGTKSNYRWCYQPLWGRHKARSFPVPGDRDYISSDASAYFNYFGDVAGDPAKGYYAYHVGTWHVIALNSNCDEIGGCQPGSEQEQWLRQELASHPSSCTVAYMHHPRFSSGEDGGHQNLQPLWQALYEFRTELVISGHDQIYERFASQDPNGNADERGVRQFVVGTGGRGHGGLSAIQPHSEMFNADTFGVLKLTLHPTSYEWEFVPVAGRTFTDSGSANCH